MNKKLIFLGVLITLVGIFFAMFLPYIESVPFWNARIGTLIGIPMIVQGLLLLGMEAEKR